MNFLDQILMNTYNKIFQDMTSPKEALQILKDGNKRFVKGIYIEKNLINQARDTSEGQFPIATILNCIDSRTSVEHIFDLGIGTVMNVKIAGNVINTDGLGSLEYACKVTKTKLIVVCGHSTCGAITAACQKKHFGNVTSLLEKIKPAIKKIEGEISSSDINFIEAVAKENVLNSINVIRRQSEILKTLEENSEIMIVGAFHNLKTGVVDFF